MSEIMRSADSSHMGKLEKALFGVLVEAPARLAVILDRGAAKIRPEERPLDSEGELRLGGIAASHVIEGLDASLEEVAVEHDPITVTRVADKKVS